MDLDRNGGFRLSSNYIGQRKDLWHHLQSFSNSFIHLSRSAHPSFCGHLTKKNAALLFQQFLTLTGSITSSANVVKDIWCVVTSLALSLSFAHFSFHLHVCDNWEINSWCPSQEIQPSAVIYGVSWMKGNVVIWSNQFCISCSALTHMFSCC